MELVAMETSLDWRVGFCNQPPDPPGQVRGWRWSLILYGQLISSILKPAVLGTQTVPCVD